MTVVHLFRTPGLTPPKLKALASTVEAVLEGAAVTLTTEICYNIDVEGEATAESVFADERVGWLLSETFEPEKCGVRSFLPVVEKEQKHSWQLEVGPRLSFCTPWSSNCINILKAAGITNISRVERSTRFLFGTETPLSKEQQSALEGALHDKMTEMVYREPLLSFALVVAESRQTTVPVMKEGGKALEKVSEEMGLGMDAEDILFYTKLFTGMGRDPTTAECFDVGQSNSEHCRHWFFKGRIVIDGEEQKGNLMEHVGATLEGPLANKTNGLINFHDNSSVITGFKTISLVPTTAGKPCEMVERDTTLHILFTAETHNFPTGVAPYPGASTGIGGRIRDGHSTGTGSHTIAGTAGYCVGNLQIPGYEQPWEDKSFSYPTNLASPLRIIVEASNGASNYGNEFGEPIIQGYTRAFGMEIGQADGSTERREWLKPIMFTGGVGQIDGRHCVKGKPAPKMLVIKLGGPAYRIGMGGGAASSMVQGENKASLDFDAVQRGDGEMAQRVHRVIRACIEMGADNPIVSIHDQGAGGNCNVLKELVEPAGGVFDIRNAVCGDKTMTALELWGAEFQENDGLLLLEESLPLFTSICEREYALFSVMGTVTGDGQVIVTDGRTGETVVDLDLEKVLGELPQKTFPSKRIPAPPLVPAGYTAGTTVRASLERVLRLLSVGSKRFLTNKVDRSVTGLIAQQQCVGPLHTPLADVAVTAQGYTCLTGTAIALGEQPIKMQCSPIKGARMSVGEALTNLVWARITALGDVKVSANWMYAAKLEGEGAHLWDACIAMKEVMMALGVSVQGGKDSLSMAARVPGGTVVKAPGALAISAYAGCPDITATVTPDFKCSGKSAILLVDFSPVDGPSPFETNGGGRLGGSALAQCFGVLGGPVPDLDDAATFARGFNVTQSLIEARKIAAGHDRSDGGLLTAVLEMAFAAGNSSGFVLDLAELGMTADAGADPMPLLFGEDLGLLLEVEEEHVEAVLAAYGAEAVRCVRIGHTCADNSVRVVCGAEGPDAKKRKLPAAAKAAPHMLLEGTVSELRDIWEATSFELEKRQCDVACVKQEQEGLSKRQAPAWKLGYTPTATPAAVLEGSSKNKVAILRTEGSNGDREMAASFHLAGFETWDITVSDLAAKRVSLDSFRGLAMVGGFSYADVLDSAKGWAASAKYHPTVRSELDKFFGRDDTFSLGVCNGCQLMALLGSVPFPAGAEEAKIPAASQPRLVHNASGRFESRFPSVKVLPSPAIMLKGMEESVLGVWICCGEGRAYFPDPDVLKKVTDAGLAPIRFVDDVGEVTEEYPLNPTGGPEGIASLCSPDGRHLAMMPHPERLTLKWQWPWMPQEWAAGGSTSPWLQMFQNAREWCDAA